MVAIPRFAAVVSTMERGLLALFEKNLPDLHARLESLVMQSAYDYCGRNQLQTARLLGISRNIVRARLLEIGLLPGGPRTAKAARGASDELTA